MEEDCKLDFVDPSTDSVGNPIASIPKSEILENVERWKNTLVGYVLGDKPFHLNLKARVGRI